MYPISRALSSSILRSRLRLHSVSATRPFTVNEYDLELPGPSLMTYYLKREVFGAMCLLKNNDKIFSTISLPYKGDYATIVKLKRKTYPPSTTNLSRLFELTQVTEEIEERKMFEFLKLVPKKEYVSGAMIDKPTTKIIVHAMDGVKGTVERDALPEQFYTEEIVQNLKHTLPPTVKLSSNEPYISKERFRCHNYFYGSKIDLCLFNQSSIDVSAMMIYLEEDEWEAADDIENIDYMQFVIGMENKKLKELRQKLHTIASLLHMAGELICARAQVGMLTHLMQVYGMMATYQTGKCIPMKLVLDFLNQKSTLYTTDEEFLISQAINNFTEYLITKA